MVTLREAAQQALEAMDDLHRTGDTQVFDLCHRETTEALRAALAEDAMQRLTDVQQKIMESEIKVDKAEPVAWMDREGDLYKMPEIEGWAPPHTMLYAAPPQRKPLTVMDLQEALVYTNLIDRDAIDDPEGYDEGSTLAQIDELHRVITGDNT